MTDLETRLTESLGGVAGRSPHPGDLATGARQRLRRRRRTTAATVAAVVVAAIPVGLAVLGGAEPDRGEPPATDTVPAGWRVESYRDLTLQVPDDWGHGGGTDWCAHDTMLAEATPEVSRPGAVRFHCSPAFGFGIVFAPEHLSIYLGDQTFPKDAFYDTVGTEQARVWVAARTQDELDRIVGSVATIDTVDANGCVETTGSALIAREGDALSVCRYDDGLLEQSELLSPEDSRAAVDAIRSAPSTAAVDPACPPSALRHPVITLQSADVAASLLPSEECPLASVFLDGPGQERVLTQDVLYWALSPGWSGSLGKELPVPDPLRTD